VFRQESRNRARQRRGVPVPIEADERAHSTGRLGRRQASSQQMRAGEVVDELVIFEGRGSSRIVLPQQIRRFLRRVRDAG